MTRTTAREIRDRIASGDVRAVDAARHALDRADAIQDLNAFLTIDRERTLTRATEVDANAERTLPLLGVPIAVKDNICVRDMRTTAGSRVLESYLPPYSATVIERLESAGAVILGKTNCDEFAMGSSTEHSAFGAAKNPWDPTRTAGGSSGGSAIAVATGTVPLALGSETGGSVRQPAALCGVLGLKPTYGRISRFGLLAFVSSVDQIGIFGTSATDLSSCLEVIAGIDPNDATSSPTAVPKYRDPVDRDIAGLRIGVPRDLLSHGIEPGVRAAFDETLSALRDAGASLVDVTLPHGRSATATYAIVVMAEASSNLSRYDGVRYGTRADAPTLEAMYAATRGRFGHEVKRRIMLGSFVLSAGYYEAYYAKALKVAALIRQDYDRAFERVDVVATPTSPTTAFRLGERIEDPVAMYLADVFTCSANLARIPAISVPARPSGGLPVGVQFTGPDWSEGLLLQVAAWLERATPWSRTGPGA